MSDLATITRHDDGAIAVVELNRPEARNALSQELIDDLRAAVADASRDTTVRVIILGGAGKAFCAGMDLKAVRTQPTQMGKLLTTLSQLMREIRRAPQPVVARVQGAAVGGGCGLMCVCDFAFTHADAKIGYPEVDLGLCPAVVAPWLIRRIGAGRARQMLLAGGTMTGRQAFEAGLATHLTTADELSGATMQFARQLCGGGPKAMATTKRWLNELDGSMEDAVLDRAAELSAKIVQGEEAQSRLAAMFDSNPGQRRS